MPRVRFLDRVHREGSNRRNAKILDRRQLQVWARFLFHERRFRSENFFKGAGKFETLLRKVRSSFDEAQGERRRQLKSFLIFSFY